MCVNRSMYGGKRAGKERRWRDEEWVQRSWEGKRAVIQTAFATLEFFFKIIRKSNSR